MKREANVETRVYRSFADDFTESSEQDYRVPDDYVWVDESRRFRAQAKVARAAGWVISTVYCKVALGLRIEGREKLDETAREGNGYFLYGNHTQPVGDACIPFLCAWPRRSYVVVSPANFKVPVIGPFLKWLGALPTSDTLAGAKQLDAAVKTRLSQGHAITVYPEAHLWPWHVNIRPLPASAFSLPVATDRPVFAMTNTYHARTSGKRPRCTVWVDGPFYPDHALPRAARKEKLRDEVQAAMMARAATSDCEYIRYVPAEGAPAMPASNGTVAAPDAAAFESDEASHARSGRRDASSAPEPTPFVAEVVDDDPLPPGEAVHEAAHLIVMRERGEAR